MHHRLRILNDAIRRKRRLTSRRRLQAFPICARPYVGDFAVPIIAQIEVDKTNSMSWRSAVRAEVRQPRNMRPSRCERHGRSSTSILTAAGYRLAKSRISEGSVAILNVAGTADTATLFRHPSDSLRRPYADATDAKQTERARLMAVQTRGQFSASRRWAQLACRGASRSTAGAAYGRCESRPLL
jgi:hypothetical protein